MGNYIEDKHNLDTNYSSTYLQIEKEKLIKQNAKYPINEQMLHEYIQDIKNEHDVIKNIFEYVINNKTGFFFHLYDDKNNNSNTEFLFDKNIMGNNYVLDTNIIISINQRNNNYKNNKKVIENFNKYGFNEIKTNVQQLDKINSKSYTKPNNKINHKTNLNDLLSEETKQYLIIVDCYSRFESDSETEICKEGNVFRGFYYFVKNTYKTCNQIKKIIDGQIYCKLFCQPITTKDLNEATQILIGLMYADDFNNYKTNTLLHILSEICIYNNITILDENVKHLFIRIMCDLKRISDWAMIKVCKENNYLFVTNDKMCAMYAILQDVKVIFELETE